MSSKRMGGSSVDANVLGVRFADGTYQTTANGTVGGSNDYTGLTAGQITSYQPVTDGVHNLVVVATSTNPQIPFTGAQLSVNVGYSDSVGPEFQDAFLYISDNNQPESANEAVFAITTAPITINTAFVTFGIAGALASPFALKGTGSTTPNAWLCPVTIASGPGAAYGATLTQANPDGGCTAFFLGVETLGGQPGQLLYTVLSGTDDFSTTGQVFVDAVSGTHYQSAGSQAPAVFTGPGYGVSMVQFVTGANGPEMTDPTGGTVLYLGPQISGVPNEPSGRIIIPGTAPSAAHNYAWYDPVNGGVFVPSAPWVDATSRLTFTYNLHIRIVPL